MCYHTLGMLFTEPSGKPTPTLGGIYRPLRVAVTDFGPVLPRPDAGFRTALMAGQIPRFALPIFGRAALLLRPIQNHAFA